VSGTSKVWDIDVGFYLVLETAGLIHVALSEAEFAMALGRPVIRTCCKVKRVHFDARQYSVIAMTCLRQRLLGFVVAAAAGLLAACMHPLAGVPDVRTPYATVRAMLELARVTSGDVVYDLGSGDGRIVIAAAREYGARGVGIEIDPALVARSRAAAGRLGLADRVHFVEQDLFKIDLASATVVTLYLSVEMNRRLRPKLLAELRPGSRIVSHDFDMSGDWTPDQVVRLQDDGREQVLYLWVVPPDRGPRSTIPTRASRLR
jgi:SAM-dependent methyltransferase